MVVYLIRSLAGGSSWWDSDENFCIDGDGNSGTIDDDGGAGIFYNADGTNVLVGILLTGRTDRIRNYCSLIG